jgi:hypothetical protein
MLFTSRIHYFIDASIKFTDWFGLGADVGIAAMYMTVMDVDIQFIDIPLRGFLRFGSKNMYFQPFCGYYMMLVTASSDSGDMGFGFGGALEVGASASLGGFYLEASYILGELTGETNFVRAGIGWVFNGIFGIGK